MVPEPTVESLFPTPDQDRLRRLDNINRYCGFDLASAATEGARALCSSDGEVYLAGVEDLTRLQALLNRISADIQACLDETRQTGKLPVAGFMEITGVGILGLLYLTGRLNPAFFNPYQSCWKDEYKRDRAAGNIRFMSEMVTAFAQAAQEVGEVVVHLRQGAATCPDSLRERVRAICDVLYRFS